MRTSPALLVLTLALAACAPAPPVREDTPKPLFWPMPPEQPRFAWEASLISPASVMMESETGRMKRLLTGSAIPTDPILEKPAGVAASQGLVYVTDTVKRRIVVFDIVRRKVFEFGWRPPGDLVKPLALALDDKGSVYVVDASRREVVVYDHLGLFQRTLGGAGQLEYPTGIAVSPDGKRIYIVDRASNDSLNHRVQVFDGEGKLLATLGRRGTGPGEFNVPVQAALAPDGTLYVLDAGNFRVQAFNPAGEFLRAFGSVGNSLGQFARPRGLAVDREGNIYVSDAAFANVQVFDSQGQLLLPIGTHGIEGGPGKFVLPAGIAVDESGRVFIADQYLRKVEVLRRISGDEGRQLSGKIAIP